jgi:hypothetical protein
VHEIGRKYSGYQNVIATRFDEDAQASLACDEHAGEWDEGNELVEPVRSYWALIVGSVGR